MESKEAKSPVGIVGLFNRLFRREVSLAISPKKGENLRELMRDLERIKNDPNTSYREVSIIQSWVYSLGIYNQQIEEGADLDRVALFDLDYIKEAALRVIAGQGIK